MATKNYRMASGLDGAFGALVDGVDQTAASRADGWTVGKITNANASDFLAGTKQATGTFAAQTGKPVALGTNNAFKTPTALTGTFDTSASWVFIFAVRATIASAQTGNMRMRVYRSVNANGSGATEITGSTQVGTNTNALSTSADVFSQVTWTPGVSITLNNEYLFFVIAWAIVVASGSNTGDVVLRTGSASLAGSYLTTPNLAAKRPITPTTNVAATSTVGGSIRLAPTTRPIAPPPVFPTTPVLDDFTQAANTTPPSANWTRYQQGTTGVDLVAVGDGTVKAATSLQSGDYWNVAQFLDTEIYARMSVVDTGSPLVLSARGSAAAYSSTGPKGFYELLYYGDGSGYFQKSGSQLNIPGFGAGGGNGLSAGDLVGFKVKGTGLVTLEAWIKQGSNPWKMVATYTDSASPITTAGYAGVAITSQTQRVDYIGGGAYIPAVAAAIKATSTVGGSVAKKVFIRPADKNLITNPSFEVNLGGWNAYVNPGIIQNDWSQSTAWAQFGTHSEHFKWTNAADTTVRYGMLYWPGVNLAALPILGGIPYTVSAYVNVIAIPADSQLSITLNWYDINGTQLSGSAGGVVATTTTGVTRIVATGTPPINAVYMVAILVNGTGLVSGVTEYYVDGVQLESGSIVTPYVEPKNLIANPSFEVDASGWSVIGVAGGTIAKSAAHSLFGSNSGLVTCVAGNDIISYGGDTGALQLGMAPNQTYTYSIYVYIPSGQPGSFNIAPQMFDNDGSGYANTTGVSAGAVFDQWVRVQVSKTIRAGSTEAFLRLVAFGATAGQIFYIEGAQLELNSVATPYTEPSWILAFSTVSGAVARLKALATAAVAATSTVSGKVQALRKITPATVAATSTVGGSVRAIHRIAPTTVISATSTVSGNVVAKRGIIPTTISATSTVSGAIGRIRKVVTAQVLATSTVSGGVTRLRPITPALVSATSTVAGSLTKIAGGFVRLITPTTVISATSTVSGAVTAIHRVAPTTVAATSTVSGSIKILRGILPTTIVATSTVSGSVRATHLIRPTTVISATSTVAGIITRLRPIVAAAIAATSTVSGSVKPLRRIAPAQILASSTVGGAVTAIHRITPSTVISATSTVSGSITAIHALVANILATSTCAGLVKRVAGILPITILATSTISGSIGVIHRITPTAIIAATSTITGSIYKHGIQVIVGASVSATSTVSGALRVIRRVAPATVAATSTVSGAVRTTHLIKPVVIAATSTVSGVVTKAPVKPIAGVIAATSTVVGIVKRLAAIRPAQIAATSTVSGNVVVRRRIPLITSISATSTITGTIKVIRRILISNVLATSTVQGSIARVRPRPLVGNIWATSTVSATLVAKPQGTIVYWPQNGRITMSKTGRIDYTTTGTHVLSKTGRINPLTTGRAVEELV